MGYLKSMRQKSIALVLDYAPQSWESRDDLHYGICRVMQQRGWGAVILHSGPIAEPVRRRYLEGGIRLEICNYALGPWHYFRELRRIVRENNVQLADVCFFNYFDWHSKDPHGPAKPWLRMPDSQQDKTVLVVFFFM